MLSSENEKNEKEEEEEDSGSEMSSPSLSSPTGLMCTSDAGELDHIVNYSVGDDSAGQEEEKAKERLERARALIAAHKKARAEREERKAKEMTEQSSSRLNSRPSSRGDNGSGADLGSHNASDVVVLADDDDPSPSSLPSPSLARAASEAMRKVGRERMTQTGEQSRAETKNAALKEEIAMRISESKIEDTAATGDALAPAKLGCATHQRNTSNNILKKKAVGEFESDTAGGSLSISQSQSQSKTSSKERDRVIVEGERRWLLRGQKNAERAEKRKADQAREDRVAALRKKRHETAHAKRLEAEHAKCIAMENARKENIRIIREHKLEKHRIELKKKAIIRQKNERKVRKFGYISNGVKYVAPELLFYGALGKNNRCTFQDMKLPSSKQVLRQDKRAMRPDRSHVHSSGAISARGSSIAQFASSSMSFDLVYNTERPESLQHSARNIKALLAVSSGDFLDRSDKLAAVQFDVLELCKEWQSTAIEPSMLITSHGLISHSRATGQPVPVPGSPARLAGRHQKKRGKRKVPHPPKALHGSVLVPSRPPKAKKSPFLTTPFQLRTKNGEAVTLATQRRGAWRGVRSRPSTARRPFTARTSRGNLRQRVCDKGRPASAYTVKKKKNEQTAARAALPVKPKTRAVAAKLKRTPSSAAAASSTATPSLSRSPSYSLSFSSEEEEENPTDKPVLDEHVYCPHCDLVCSYMSTVKPGTVLICGHCDREFKTPPSVY
jgi:hypothetical protein